MGQRPTNTNEGASGQCRGINNLDRAFNRAGAQIRMSLCLVSGGGCRRGGSSTGGWGLFLRRRLRLHA